MIASINIIKKDTLKLNDLCDEKYLKSLIKKSGLQNKHSRALAGIFQHIQRTGKYPTTIYEFIRFGEVKSKTAALALFGCGQHPETIPVDVHVENVLFCWGIIANTKDREEIGWQPQQMIKRDEYEEFNNMIGSICQKLEKMETRNEYLTQMMKIAGDRLEKNDLLPFIKGYKRGEKRPRSFH